MTDMDNQQEIPAEPANAETDRKPLVWRKSLPKWSLWVSLAVLAWFALAVFGPKIGLIGWRTGLGFMIMQSGLILIGIAAVFALVALLFAFLKTPRGPWWKAALALAIPAILFLGLLTMRAQADAVPPIHDVSTDLRNPPTFSAQTMAIREELGANPINDYGIPLGQLEMWAGSEDADLKAKNHADIIAEDYENLQPIIIGGATDDQAFDAIVAAMGEIGLQDVHRVEGSNTVEGVAETFAFGFKDDVVARVEDGQIDLRSVSRVGVSDLGYNASRLEELAEAIEDRLNK
ncbi:DUF1499 domain-containing protein [Qipengyuania gelatinilytica]|uniref:DUF1499 domain-containing protein n=1 Tax=Qipengyuania gelatinilytica TaxID=2867231 RepID=A0ABX9A8G2_9SPHN|nr:DUF1499 domain-containing protein [Qipengyuania gelatinilytica]QZD96067.1 DUF1499 domain-containing protein [Qipengyuania gelatinilytica]